MPRQKKLTRDERIDGLLVAEAMAAKESIWWISFADETGNLGVIITRDIGFTHALQKTHQMGINPSGSVQGLEIPIEEHEKYCDYYDRLLSKAELKEAELI